MIFSFFWCLFGVVLFAFFVVTVDCGFGWVFAWTGFGFGWGQFV